MMRLALALVSKFVKAAAIVSPRALRARWTEEWLAELEHASQPLRSQRFGALRLVMMACGAAIDVVLLRRLPRSPAPASTPRRIMPGFGQDFRYALRGIAASPGFAFGVIASLALAIAANTTAFSFINAAVFRPFPGVADQDRLVRISMSRGCGRPNCDVRTSSYDDYVVMREGIGGLNGAVAARTSAPIAAMIRREARSLKGALVSANYFDVLGVTPLLGRGFAPEEESLAQAFVAVISYNLWTREFHADPSVLGQSIDVSGGSARIVGVAPQHFSGATKGEFAGRDGRGTEIFLPLPLADLVSMPERAGVPTAKLPHSERYYSFFGRLQDGTDASSIRAQADALAAGIAASRPGTHQGMRLDVTGVWLNDPARMAPAIAMFLAVPLVVLAIACVNAANLLLARATRRDREIAVRLALGATRWRIIRQLLVESAILAMASAAAALVLGYYASQLVFRFLPVPMLVDYRDLAYTLALAFVSTIGFGLVPALRVTVGHPQGALTGGQSAAGAPRHGRMRRALIVAQVALSLGLLATGAQFVSSVGSMGGTAGTDPERLLLASFNLDQLKYSPAAAQEFYRQLLERVTTVPQADGAGLARISALWTWGLGRGSSFVNVWRPEDGPKNGTSSLGGYVAGDLFAAVGLRVLQGRAFAAEDAGGSPRVAIVNRPFADRMFNGAAVGRTVRVGSRGQPYERAIEVQIVGMVEGVSEPSYSPRPVPALYLPSPIEPEPALALYVKSRGPLDTLVPALRQAVRDIDPRVPFTELASLRQLNDIRLQEDVWSANGVMLLGCLALLLATAGLYGVVSYVVAMRSREIGVRMALGAEPRAMVRMVMKQAMALAVTGAVIGAGAALAIGQIVRSEMHDVRGLDVTAFLGSTAILIVAMLAASAVPARRAARTDPMIVLRQD
jgi:putative ABC transport system permease protein